MITNNIKYAIFIFLSFTGLLCAQGIPMTPSNPATSALMQFESNPVSLYSGVPQISVPLYKMPTLSPEISIDIAMNYHSLSVVSYDSITGMYGRGWTLTAGGAILRETPNPSDMTGVPANNNKGAFTFNFMGYSGKFSVAKNSSGDWIPTISENSGAKLEITLSEDANGIASFRIYDDKGYEYIFETTEQYIYVNAIFNPQFISNEANNWRVPLISAFHLTRILDNSNNTLATFNYGGWITYENYYIAGEQTTHKGLESITVEGYGSIEINQAALIVKDYNGGVVRQFGFEYSQYNKLLTQINESDELETRILSHKFYYRDIANSPLEMLNVDNWGYYNSIPKNSYLNYDRSQTRYASPVYCTKNVLEKMELPTGGAVVYQYESNTYSYKEGIPLDRYYDSPSETYLINPSYFSGLNAANANNFTFSPFPLTFAGSGIYTFSLSSSKNLCFSFFSAGYYLDVVEGQPPIQVFANFKLKKQSGGVWNLVYDFGDEDYGSGFNGGHGKNFLLSSGNYRIEVASQPAVNSIQVTEPVLNPTIKKEHLGNGIRIRKIGHFTDGSVPQNYYYLTGQALQPVKETTYDYNLFTDPNRSSGTLTTVKTINEWFWLTPWIENTPNCRNETMWYKNVTVTELGNNGKIRYEFVSPLDFPETDYYSNRFTYGRIKRERVYNAAGTLIKSTGYDYEYHPTGFISLPMYWGSPSGRGWSRPTVIKDTLFYPGSHFVENIKKFSYAGNRKLLRETSMSSISTDSLSTQYSYYATPPLSLEPFNRITDVERIDQYYNSELTSTSSTVYATLWPYVDEGVPSGAPNIARWPSTVQSAKGSNTAKLKMKYNKYDNYNHLLESEQPGGIKTVYLWGYRHSQIVAKIENIAYADIPKALIDDIRAKSNTGTEAQLLTAFTNLRNATQLAAARITTYTYKPLIGVSKVIDIKRQTTTFEYDVLGRLTFVKDHKGKILSENEYHYLTDL